MVELFDVAKRFADAGNDANVAVGLRPSGRIHLGNMYTMGLAGLLSREIGPHLADVNLTICDLDLPDQSDWSVRDHGFVKYFGALPAPAGSEGSLLDHSRAGIENFAGGLSDYFGVNFNISLLSDIQRMPGYREGLKRIFEEPGLMQKLMPNAPEGKILAFPLCPKCHTSAVKSATGYSEGVLSTTCTNPECGMGDYRVGVGDCDVDIAVHFFIDPMRDSLVSPRADVHVFGGDYKLPHFGSTVSRVDKIREVVKIASSDGYVPEYVLGPLFYARDGNKMSKSKDNGLNVGSLKKFFGDKYALRVGEFVERIANRGFSHIDYAVVETELLERVH